jgi:predicted TIM-barrel fold metal-dependent hydrolase
MDVDDVAIDFPKLNILLAHGGRPLWMERRSSSCAGTARLPGSVRHPPRSCSTTFPRLEGTGGKTIWGTDWPVRDQVHDARTSMRSCVAV